MHVITYQCWDYNNGHNNGTCCMFTSVLCYMLIGAVPNETALNNMIRVLIAQLRYQDLSCRMQFPDLHINISVCVSPRQEQTVQHLCLLDFCWGGHSALDIYISVLTPSGYIEWLWPTSQILMRIHLKINVNSLHNNIVILVTWSYTKHTCNKVYSDDIQKEPV